MITNFISKSLEFIGIWICQKSRELFLFKRNDKRNRKDTKVVRKGKTPSSLG